MEGPLAPVNYFIHFVVVLKAAVLLVSTTVSAQPSSSTELLKTFETAYSLAGRSENKRFKELASTLNGHPLYPYLVQKRLLAYPYLSNEKVIRSFLARHQDTPLDTPLRKKWLRYLKRKKQIALFNEFYKDYGDTELTCHFLHNKLLLGDEFSSIVSQVQALWTVGKSQPTDCDPLFEKLTKAQLISEAMLLTRIEKVADGGNHTLLPYLKQQLSNDKQYLVDLWYRTRRSPASLASSKAFVGKYPAIEKKIILYGLKRLVWKDPDKAIQLWQNYQQNYLFSEVTKRDMTAVFALRLSVNKHPQASQWFSKIAPQDMTKPLLQWFVADVLRKKDWSAIVTLIDQRSQLAQESLEIQYWYGTALLALEQKRQGLKVLADVAKHRHYYGFLASHHLKQPLQLLDKPLTPTSSQLDAISQLLPAQRARAFVKLDMLVEARREWRYLLSTLPQSQHADAAVLAHSWDWHDQAISTFVSADYYNDVQRRFPLVYKDLMLQSAQSADIDPAWAFAIVRKESAFSSDARSSAGARGLMQLLPSTANYIAKQKVRANSLYNPNFNVKYGTRYLKYLLGKTDNNPVLATAAYNAGWRNVKKWAPKADKVRFDIWVETIPFRETRDYVKSVIAYHQIYAMMLDIDERQRMFTSLPQLFVRRTDFGL